MGLLFKKLRRLIKQGPRSGIPIFIQMTLNAWKKYKEINEAYEVSFLQKYFFVVRQAHHERKN